MARIACSACDAPMRISDDQYGQRVRCDECGAVFRVDDELLDEGGRRAPKGKKRRRKKSSGSLGPLPWIIAGVTAAFVALIGGGVGIVLLVRAAPNFSFPSASPWVNVSLPEGISFSSPGQLALLPHSPLPNGKAYGYEAKNAVVGVMTMTMPPGFGANSTDMLAKFETNLRQNDPQASLKQVRVDGQPVLEVEKVDSNSRFRGWIRIAIVEDQLIGLMVVNEIRNTSTSLRDQVFRSMRLPGRTANTLLAGVTSTPAAAPGDNFSRLNSFFGPPAPQTTPIMPMQMPGGMAGGPPGMPATPGIPAGGNASGVVTVPGGIPNMPGAAPGAAPSFPVGPSFPHRMPGQPGFGGPPIRRGRPGMGPGAMPPGGMPKGPGGAIGRPGRP